MKDLGQNFQYLYIFGWRPDVNIKIDIIGSYLGQYGRVYANEYNQTMEFPKRVKIIHEIS